MKRTRIGASYICLLAVAMKVLRKWNGDPTMFIFLPGRNKWNWFLSVAFTTPWVSGVTTALWELPYFVCFLHSEDPHSCFLAFSWYLNNSHASVRAFLHSLLALYIPLAVSVPGSGTMCLWTAILPPLCSTSSLPQLYVAVPCSREDIKMSYLSVMSIQIGKGLRKVGK